MDDSDILRDTRQTQGMIRRTVSLVGRSHHRNAKIAAEALREAYHEMVSAGDLIEALTLLQETSQKAHMRMAATKFVERSNWLQNEAREYLRK